MKKSFLLIMKQFTRAKVSWLTFNLALFLTATSAFALEIDNSASAVAVNVPDTIKMGTDLYSCYMAHASAVVDDSQIDVAQPDDWFQYKISSVEGGMFNAVLKMATQRETGKVNVSLYTTEGVLVQSGLTYGTYNGSWTNTIDYKYPLVLDAGVEYLMKVSLIDAGTNIKGIIVQAATESADATLASLSVGGMAVDGFDPAIYSYEYTATETVAQVELGATANEASALVTGTGLVDVVEGDNALAIKVTAEDGSELTYTVNVFNPYSSSIDATLSTLTVDGDTVEGFDPATYSYTVFLPIGTDTVTVGAVTNDVLAQGVEGIGDTALVEGRTSMTLTVTSESGLTQDYMLNLVTPIQVNGMRELAMLDDIVSVPADKSPRVNNTQINWWNAGEYIEYYVYSETDEMISFAVNAANADAGNSSLNVSTYIPDSVANWMLDEANTEIIPGGAGDWGADYASNVYYDLDLEANKPVIVRLQCVTNANGNSLANVYGFSLTAVDSVQTDKVRMVPTVEGDSATLFQFIPHVTKTEGQVVVQEKVIDSTKDGAYAEFQIKSATAGVFDAIIKMGTQKPGAKVNIGVYKTETETWSANGDTLDIVQGGWTDQNEYAFRISLDADEVYTMRINFISTTNNWVGNLHEIVIEEYVADAVATLSDLQLDGMTISGFSPNVMSYQIDLPKGSTEVPTATATATIDGASVVVTEAATLSDTTKIVVTSVNSEVVNTYMVSFSVAGPYMGVPATIPGIVEFEHFDLGGEGVAYHDDASKSGDATIRPYEMVDMEINGDRINVSNTAAGEWLSYTINVEASADYQLRTSMASNSAGDVIVYVDEDSIDVYTPTATGAWQTYAITVLDTIYLEAGEHVIKMEFSGASVRLNPNWFALFDKDDLSSDASLASIALNDSVTLEGFDPATMSYTVMIDSLEQIGNMVSAVASDEYAMVSITQASQVNQSKAVITVTAQDLQTVETYEVMFELIGTAVKEVSAKADVKLYPNPAQDILNISAKNEIVSVQLYSISGALVKEYSNIGSRDLRVDLDLSEGVYFVSVSTTGGMSTQKLIKK